MRGAQACTICRGHSPWNTAVVVVDRLICIQEVPGSIPGLSRLFGQTCARCARGFHHRYGQNAAGSPGPTLRRSNGRQAAALCMCSASRPASQALPTAQVLCGHGTRAGSCCGGGGMAPPSLCLQRATDFERVRTDGAAAIVAVMPGTCSASQPVDAPPHRPSPPCDG